MRQGNDPDKMGFWGIGLSGICNGKCNNIIHICISKSIYIYLFIYIYIYLFISIFKYTYIYIYGYGVHLL